MAGLSYSNPELYLLSLVCAKSVSVVLPILS
jgi:hypothetical protein